MSLSDLASLGSFVSGVAVVITLIFLLLQMRQAASATRRAEATATQSAASTFRMAIVNNRDVARLVAEGLSGESELDAIDQLRFESLLGEIIWFSQHVWDRQQVGIFDEGEWERSADTFINGLLLSPRGAQWWQKNKSNFPEKFRTDVDKAIAGGFVGSSP